MVTKVVILELEDISVSSYILKVRATYHHGRAYITSSSSACVLLMKYSSHREAHIDINKYLQYYNEKRLHQSLKYKTPEEIYFKDSR